MRNVQAFLFAVYMLLTVVSLAQADDFSGPVDGETPAKNINAATGLAGAITGGAIAFWLLTRKRQDDDDPCKNLRDEVKAGEERLRDLESELRRRKTAGDDARLPDMPGRKPLWIANIGQGPGGPMPENPPDLLNRPSPTEPSTGGKRPHDESSAPLDDDHKKWIASIGNPPGTKMPDKLPDRLITQPKDRMPAGTRPRAEDAPGDIIDAMSATRAARRALDAERAAQAKRLAALGACMQRAKADSAVDPDALKNDLDDLKRKFEELEKKLREAAAGEMEKMDRLNAEYNTKWAEAMKAIEEYLHIYPSLIPDMAEIWDAMSDRQLGRKIADWTDTVIQALMLGHGLKTLAAGSAARAGMTKAGTAGKGLSAEGKAATAGKALTAEGKAATAGKALANEGKAASGKAGAMVDEITPQNIGELGGGAGGRGATFTGPDGKPSFTKMLSGGEDGKNYLDQIMQFKSNQHDIYAASVNKYAQQMIKGEFQWSKVAAEPIVIENGVITNGHHRMIAAELASKATGRPVFGGANPIIPESAIKISGNAAGASQVPAWSRTTNLINDFKPQSGLPEHLIAERAKELEALRGPGGPFEEP